ncbi:sodium:proton antiporter [Halalkalibacter urbisdiaboli]|uniref:sodium:proton antiporter n=1 Tax=Halalkalibacter urbisdiaboli TaxID=1960589 RepID=UPI001FDA165D|nr:sodium:proton antiporter [Halalkalibacter urbisdiaboli]
MINRLFSMISLAVSFYFAYRYRYRVINAMLGRKWLRKLAVGLAMQIPMVRDKMMGSVFQFNRSNQMS